MKSFFLSALIFFSTTVNASDFPRLGNLKGEVIHNLVSSSSLNYLDGIWSDCKKDENFVRYTCNLQETTMSIGLKTINFSRAVYTGPSAASSSAYYDLSGSMLVGSNPLANGHPQTVHVRILVDENGGRRAFIEIQRLAILEQIIF